MLKNNGIVIVNYIIKSENEIVYKLIVKKLLNPSPLFSEPIISSIIGLYNINFNYLSDFLTIDI